ncbi:MAG: hypothetical protein KF745_13425 [Phycisphaeraceae bacterium]|nr:hypothetical protein [Phycisphaeraceae bacterium]
MTGVWMSWTIAGAIGAGALSGCVNRHQAAPQPAAQAAPPTAPSGPTWTPAAAEPPAPVAPAVQSVWDQRPSWWIDQPVAGEGTLSVAAMADDSSLSAALRAAVDSAAVQLKDRLGSDPDSVSTKSDTLRLPDGRYRAFVRSTAAVK